VVVEVDDGSRQLIAVHNTELADARPPTSILRFTPGSLRALLAVISDCRRRMACIDGDADGFPDRPADMAIVSGRDAPAGGGALGRAVETPATPFRPGKARRGSRR